MDKWKSSVKRKTLIPVYNEAFQFDILGKDINDLVLEVLMMDYDRFSKNDMVGKVVLGGTATGESELRHWQDMISSAPQVVSQWHTIKRV